jgi:nicotinate-nucleotide adenylyltransferase
MKTIIYGGSFDPLHIIHLTIAQEACRQLGASRVLFLPSGKNPFKETSGVLPQHRLAMLKLAIAPFSWADVCSYEVDKFLEDSTKATYSFDTLRYLLSNNKIEEQPYLLLGDDVAAGFENWYCRDQLLNMVQIVLAKRGTNNPNFAYPHILLNNSAFPLASSQIRPLIKNGQSYQFLVPPAVYNYIEQEGLYR